MVQKIDKLTREQEATIPEWLDKYWRLATGIGQERKPIAEVQGAVLGILDFAKIARAKNPVIVVESPLSAQLLANVWPSLIAAMQKSGVELGGKIDSSLGSSLDSSLYSSLDSSLGSSLYSSLYSSLRSSLYSSLGSSLDSSLCSSLDSSLDSSLRSSLRSSLYSSLDSSLRSSLDSSLYSSLYSSLDSSLDSSLGSSKMELKNRSYYGMWDCPLYAYISYGHEVLGTEFEPDTKRGYDAIQRLIHAGVCELVAHENLIIASRLPTRISFDAEKRLHNTTGPSVEWGDGWRQYNYRNVLLEPWMIEEPNKLNAKDILKEPNVERRWALTELLGKERFLAGLDPKIVDSVTDRAGMPCRLLRVDMGDGIQPRYYTEVTDPAQDGRRIHERVGGEPKTYWDAYAWQWNLKDKTRIQTLWEK